MATPLEEAYRRIAQLQRERDECLDRVIEAGERVKQLTDELGVANSVTCRECGNERVIKAEKSLRAIAHWLDDRKAPAGLDVKRQIGYEIALSEMRRILAGAGPES